MCALHFCLGINFVPLSSAINFFINSARRCFPGCPSKSPCVIYYSVPMKLLCMNYSNRLENILVSSWVQPMGTPARGECYCNIYFLTFLGSSLLRLGELPLREPPSIATCVYSKNCSLVLPLQIRSTNGFQWLLTLGICIIFPWHLYTLPTPGKKRISL